MKKVIFCLLILLPLFAHAQQRFTLGDAIDTALLNNFEIRIARNLSEISKVSNSYGMAGGLPAVNLNATNNNSRYNLHQKLNSGVDIKKDNVSNSSLNTGLSAGMLLFNGFRVVAAKERLNILEKQGEIELNRQIQNTIAAVMVLYYDIVRQQSYLSIIQSLADVSAARLDIVKERLNIGMANDADLLQAQIDLNQVLQNFQSQELVIAQGKASLLELIGVREFFPIMVDDTILVDRTIRLDSVLNYLDRNPQYISADYQVHISEQIVKEQRALRFPSVRVSTGYNFNYNSSSAGFNLFTQNYGPALGATLQVPVFNGTVYRRQQEVAMLNAMNAELQKESIFTSIKADALKTYMSYERTLQLMEAQQVNYENAAKLVSLVLEKYRLGQSTILDVKAAQASYESAGNLVVNLQYSAKIAEIELNRLVYRLVY